MPTRVARKPAAPVALPLDRTAAKKWARSVNFYLEALPGHDAEENLLKIVIPHGERKEALKGLWDMGISRTSLFPGLEGFAQTLGIFHPVVHDPIPWRNNATG